MSPPRILLLQVRDQDDPIRDHELACFRTRLPDAEFVVRNLLYHPPEGGVLDEVDVVMMGGSGDYSCVGNEEPWFLEASELLREVVRRGLPVFASCWGVQHLAVALGGRVERAGGDCEIGTYELELTEAGRQDPVFGSLPSPFLAQLGHKDRVAELPPGAVVLARSPRCAVQAFRLDGSPVYATQFHPELTAADNLERMYRYRRHYEDDAAAFQAMLDSFRESGDTLSILPGFMRLIGTGDAVAEPSGPG